MSRRNSGAMLVLIYFAVWWVKPNYIELPVPESRQLIFALCLYFVFALLIMVLSALSGVRGSLSEDVDTTARKSH